LAYRHDGRGLPDAPLIHTRVRVHFRIGNFA
jgi:hypothetical protein